MKSQLNWWDRFLMSLAPTWGLERVRARAIADVISNRRNYEAASLGRRTTGWNRNYSDVNRVNAVAITELRAHCRDLVRNNGWARRAQRIVANNTVGWGVTPKPVNDPSGRAIQLWREWAGSTQCDSEGRRTFSGILRLAMRTLVDSGEVLIRRRGRRPEDKLAIDMQLQVLEPDFLDHQKEESVSLAGGPTISGVEYDKLGRRAAYWLFATHPGNGLLPTEPSRRIPASEVIHFFSDDRSGQARGIPWLATAIVNLKDLDAYEDAELMKQKIAACFAAFITDDGVGVTQLGDQDPDDETITTFEPGMIHELKPGKKVEFGVPPTVVNDSLTTRTLRRVAASLGVTYEDLTGDYSQVNYSSARMGRLVHLGYVRDWQEELVIPGLCAPVWAWAMDAAELAGKIPAAPAAVWTASPMPMLEPDKEGLAVKRAVRTGLSTFSQMIREQGGDPDQHWAEYAEDLKKLDTLGIKLDTDPRAVSDAGLTQERAGGGGGQGEAAPKKPEEAPTRESPLFEVDLRRLRP